MMPMGRGRVVMKVMEARKAMPPSMEYNEDEDDMGGGGGDFASMARGHFEKGLAMAKKYMNGGNGQSPDIRAKVEALSAAYEDLMASLGNGGNGGEDEY